jgi:hypothetical protein
VQQWFDQQTDITKYAGKALDRLYIQHTKLQPQRHTLLEARHVIRNAPSKPLIHRLVNISTIPWLDDDYSVPSLFNDACKNPMPSSAE